MLLNAFFNALYALCEGCFFEGEYVSCVIGGSFCVADHDIQGEFDLFVPRLLCTCCDV
jgi:hypothetical protein